MIAFKNVTKRFAGAPALDGVTLEVPDRQVTFVIGPSGAGKSVLSRCAVGLTRPDAGEVWVDGERIDALPERRLSHVRRSVALLLQAAPLLDWMTLAENVELPLRKVRGFARRRASEEALRLLTEVELAGAARSMPGELGPGARRRAGIARALALAPRCIIYDEPTTGLPPAVARRIDALIRRIVDGHGGTALVVSHDLDSVRGIADRVAMLYAGRIRAEGPPREVAASPDPIVSQFWQGRPEGPMEIS